MSRPLCSIVVAGCACLLLGLAPVPRQDASSKAELCLLQFGECKSALGEIPSAFSAAIDASIKQERLQDRKGKEKGGNDWPCESALLDAKDRSQDLRKAAGSLVKRAENRWNAAKSTARDLPADKLPWAAKDLRSIGEAITRTEALFKKIDSSKTSADSKKLASLWKAAQEYASELPKVLPAVKAESIVPSRVVVPCIGEVVSVRPGS